MAKIIVSVINDLNTDQRVHKMCSFMLAKGNEVLLVGRRQKKSLPMENRPYATHRMKLLAEKGALFYAFFNVRLFFLLLFRKADCLVANDLDTLLANYLVSKIKRIPLVYDTHEYFTEVPELISRPRVQKVWLRIEGWIFPKLKTVITVNQSISDRYFERYGIRARVVRNVSPQLNLSHVASRKALGLPENIPLLIMQGAGLNVDRGVEEAINAMHFVSSAKLIIVGDGDIIPEMKQKVVNEQLEEKVLFFGKRPYAELIQFTHHATLGFSFDQPTNPNYLFSLPNKIFDYIHTETPILCSDVVEVKKIVTKYDLGTVVTNFEAQALAAQIETILSQPELLAEWRKNCKFAAEREHWDAEVSILSDVYSISKT